MIDHDDLQPDVTAGAVPDPGFWIPPCPYRSQPDGKGAAPICDDEDCCRCAHDIERALRVAIGRVLGDIAAKSALGLDKKSAVVAIARAEGAAFGCKSLSAKVHPRWSAEHVAVHGELPSGRTMRRWYRSAFEAHPEPRAEPSEGSTLEGGAGGSSTAAGARP